MTLGENARRIITRTKVVMTVAQTMKKMWRQKQRDLEKSEMPKERDLHLSKKMKMMSLR